MPWECKHCSKAFFTVEAKVSHEGFSGLSSPFKHDFSPLPKPDLPLVMPPPMSHFPGTPMGNGLFSEKRPYDGAIVIRDLSHNIRGIIGGIG